MPAIDIDVMPRLCLNYQHILRLVFFFFFFFFFFFTYLRSILYYKIRIAKIAGCNVPAYPVLVVSLRCKSFNTVDLVFSYDHRL